MSLLALADPVGSNARRQNHLRRRIYDSKVSNFHTINYNNYFTFFCRVLAMFGTWMALTSSGTLDLPSMHA